MSTISSLQSDINAYRGIISRFQGDIEWFGKGAADLLNFLEKNTAYL